jgi:hypothetical protein
LRAIENIAILDDVVWRSFLEVFNNFGKIPTVIHLIVDVLRERCRRETIGRPSCDVSWRISGWENSIVMDGNPESCALVNAAWASAMVETIESPILINHAPLRQEH